MKIKKTVPPPVPEKAKTPQENPKPLATAANVPAVKTDTVTVPLASKAQPFVSLALDDAKPGAPDAATEPGRFPPRPRDITIPLLYFNPQGLSLANPLPASSLGTTPATALAPGVVLKGTPTTPQLNFAVTDMPSQVVAAVFDDVSKKFPKLESSVVWRLAKVATFVGIDVPLMVASHEMGHGGAAVDACPSCSPMVTMTGWMSGYTSYNMPDDVRLTEQQSLMMSVAGMNQATYNGEEINRRMHTQGADVADAVAYLVQITNSMNYQVKDWVKQSPPGYNDGATYHAFMESRQKGWNQENLSLLAAGVNLLNADFWASLIGTGRYIANGKQVKLPEVKIGPAYVSMPHFSLMNTFEGPLLNTSVYGHLGSKETLELKYSSLLTPDNGPAMALEARLHQVSVPGTNDSLSFSPRVGLAVHDQQIGYKAGLGLEFRPGNNQYYAVTAGVDYRKKYLPEQFLPKQDEVQGGMALKLNF